MVFSQSNMLIERSEPIYISMGDCQTNRQFTLDLYSFVEKQWMQWKSFKHYPDEILQRPWMFYLKKKPYFLTIGFWPSLVGKSFCSIFAPLNNIVCASTMQTCLFVVKILNCSSPDQWQILGPKKISNFNKENTFYKNKYSSQVSLNELTTNMHKRMQNLLSTKFFKHHSLTNGLVSILHKYFNCEYMYVDTSFFAPFGLRLSNLVCRCILKSDDEMTQNVWIQQVFFQKLSKIFLG